jgi:uncharacterized protein (DUF3820 family)
MISKIYSSNTPLFKVGERKGKSKKEIEKMVSKRIQKTKTKNVKSTEQTLSNFINCKGGYFNKGKYKGKMIINVPIKYLLWVYENIENLNQSEIRVLSSSIEKKLKKMETKN